MSSINDGVSDFVEEFTTGKKAEHSEEKQAVLDFFTQCIDAQQVVVEGVEERMSKVTTETPTDATLALLREYMEKEVFLDWLKKRKRRIARPLTAYIEAAGLGF